MEVSFFLLPGTVCIMGSAGQDGDDAVRRLCDLYSEFTCRGAPQTFSGSSPGASSFGHVRIKLT